MLRFASVRVREPIAKRTVCLSVGTSPTTSYIFGALQRDSQACPSATYVDRLHTPSMAVAAVV